MVASVRHANHRSQVYDGLATRGLSTERGHVHRPPIVLMGTVTKALSLLNHFGAARPEIGLSGFRALTGRDKATLHRHLSELAACGFLQQDAATRAYRLGPAVLRLGGVREATFPARRAVRPIVDALSESLGELVHVSLLQGDVMSPLYHRDARCHATRVSFDEAELLPLHATASGLAMLAFGPEALLPGALERDLERHTERTTVDPDALRAAVDGVRETGIARVDQGYEIEVESLAVPAYDGTGEGAAASVAVALPVSRADDDSRARIARALAAAGEDVTRELGGRVPEALLRRWRAIASDP